MQEWGGAFIVWSLIATGVATGSFAVMAWLARRELHHAHHFYTRQQAALRMEQYLIAAALLLLFLLLLATYWFGLFPDPVQMAVGWRGTPTPIAATSTPHLIEPTATFLPTPTPTITPTPRPTRPPLPTRPPRLELPAEYAQVTGRSEIGAETMIGELQFSQSVTEAYRPINPQTNFPPDTETLYATFDYRGMNDGLAWSYLWRYGNKIIEGGNELWQYGRQGPGYLYLSPEEGLLPGEYTAEVWLNGQLMQRSSVTIAPFSADTGAEEEIPLANRVSPIVTPTPALSQGLPSFDAPALAEGVSSLAQESPELALGVPSSALTISSPQLVIWPATGDPLPVQYALLTPTAPLPDEVNVRLLRFTADYVSDDVFALSAALFPQAMNEGVSWAWVWRHNGRLLGGGAELWQKSAESIRYLHFAPPTGFSAGSYTLELWLNDTLFSRASIDVAIPSAHQ